MYRISKELKINKTSLILYIPIHLRISYIDGGLYTGEGLYTMAGGL